MPGAICCCRHLSELDGIATSKSLRVKLIFLDPKPSLLVILGAEKMEADAEVAALHMHMTC